MQDIISYCEEVNDELRRILNGMEYTSPDSMGLDRRAGYRLWINEDCIVVDKANDRVLQYYGGFEYVDSEYRIEMGDYVIYLADDERVQGHIDTYYQRDEEGVYTDEDAA
jgi:hypothetical protein